MSAAAVHLPPPTSPLRQQGGSVCLSDNWDPVERNKNSAAEDLKHNNNNSDSEDENDTVFVAKTSKTKRRVVLEDESEDEETGISKFPVSHKVNDLADDDDLGDQTDKSDGESYSTDTSTVRRHVKPFPKDDEEDSSNETVEPCENSPDTGKKRKTASSSPSRRQSGRQSEKRERTRELHEKFKSYKMRNKKLSDGPTDTDKEEEESDPAIFKDKDLFSADESDNNTNDDGSENDDIVLKEDGPCSDDSPVQCKEKTEKLEKMRKAKITAKDKIQTKSEQQRLLRSQPLKIACHQPTLPSLKDFLARVPLSGKKKCANAARPESKKDKSPTKDARLDFPRLQATSDEIVFEDTDDDPKVESKQENKPAGKAYFERFFKKTQKVQTKREVDSKLADPGKNSSLAEDQAKDKSGNGANDVENKFKKPVIDLEKIDREAKLRKVPGSRLVLLKDQLLKGIKAAREETRNILAANQKEYNEDFTDEEDAEFSDSEESEGEDGSEDKGDTAMDGDGTEKRNVKKVFHSRTNKSEKGKSERDADQDSDDEELRKWNADDSFRQLENEVEKSFVEDDGLEEVSIGPVVDGQIRAVESSNELFSAANDSGSLSVSSNDHSLQHDGQLINTEIKPTIDWEDSSTMQLAQGEPSKNENSVNSFSTPFSKLLKSGLLGSTRKHPSPVTKETQSPEEKSMQTTPIHIEEDQDTMQSLHLALDEDTQFSQILDTQGYLQPRKVAKKPQVKRLFCADSSSPSMSDALELCSGNFEDAKKRETGSESSDFKLPNALPSIVTKKAPKGLRELLDAPLSSPTSENATFNLWKFDGKDATDKSDIKTDFKLPSGFQMKEATNKDDSQEELIGLCSGTFATTQADSSVVSRKEPSKALEMFPETNPDEEDLLALCSGKFYTQTQNVTKCGNSENKESPFHELFSLSKVSDETNVRSKEDPDFLSNKELQTDDSMDEDEDTNAEENNGDEEDSAEECEDEEDVVNSTDMNIKGRKFDKKNFYEEEAELSGSDMDSGDEDFGSEYDEYEEESEVEELPSDEELWDQVKKVHMKEVMDEDKQALRRYQEMYLEDGDLHSEGGGRKRNFRWRNIDDNSQFQLFNHKDGSDGEYDQVDEELSQQELQRKIERFERDTFLMEQEKSEDAALLDENSQSILNLIRDTSKSQTPDVEHSVTAKVVKASNSGPMFKRSGSFLNRDQSSLQRISSMSSIGKGRVGSGRAVVFQSRSSEDKGEPKKDMKKDMRRTNSMSDLPVAKKPRLDKNVISSQGQSVFDHF